MNWRAGATVDDLPPTSRAGDKGRVSRAGRKPPVRAATRPGPQRAGFVSAAEVAERAGVSRSAVSRTFSGTGSVSPATRRKVLKAAEELGFHANRLARSLSGVASDLVCLIAADVDQPFQSRMLEQVTRRLQAQGKVAMVVNTAGDEESVSNALRQSLHYRASASVVLTGTPSPRLVQTCLANGQRLVLVNRAEQGAGVDSIAVDSAQATAEAVALLARAGCRRLACVSSRAGTPSLLAREQGFAAAAAREGLPVELVRAGPTSYATGLEAARLLLGRASPPDGVFAVTDLLALGFMDGARDLFGRRIPEDICVIGFDDIPQASWTAYELTTFRQPVEEIAEQIAAALSSPATPAMPRTAPDEPAGGRAETAPVASRGARMLTAPPVWRATVRLG